MISVNNIGLRFGKRVLFDNVNMKFEGNNCYGLIGANGAGKSTFLKILSGEVESTSGEVVITKGERMSALKQNHNEYDEYTVLETVIGGDSELYEIMKEKDELYAKENFTEKDGIKVGELEDLFLKKNGWEAESNAAVLLAGLGVTNDLFDKKMSELKDTEKVKVLLARALFGEPDILLLDEPTNGLDVKSKMWLEEFLINFKNTVLVVSHDRHFLNNVCTYMVDIDFEKITLFVGNYDFWYESSQLIQKQMRESNKRKEDKIEELQAFIRRFSANASKSKQATSRKKLLEKISLDDIKPSLRKYPYINFEMEKRLGKDVISLEKISIEVEGKTLVKDFTMHLSKDDRVAIVGDNELAKTALLDAIANNNVSSGEIKLGTTVDIAYFPKNHDNFFEKPETLIDWLRKYSDVKEESFVRGFLGRMLFSGEEATKMVNVLSGGEKVRSMMAKIMLQKGNVLLLDEPTNHLDIESITALNKGLASFDSTLIFTTNDLEMIESLANRIIEIKEDGKVIDKQITYSEYLEKYGK